MKIFISFFALAIFLCLPLLNVTQLSAQTAEEDAIAEIVETGDTTATATEEETTEDTASTKFDILRAKIHGKANGLQNAPGLQKPFNPKSKWGRNSQ